MPRIGAQNFTVAKVLTDVISGATTYDAPVSFTKKLMKIGVKGNSNMVNLEADDQVVDTIEGRGDVQVDIDLTELTEDEKALLFGQTMVGGVRTTNPAGDAAPFFCIMWKSKKSNGKYKYYKILKTKFMEPDEDFETKKQSPQFQTDKISGKGIPRLSDGNDKRILDADSASYDVALANAWFTTGDITVDAVAPTLSSTLPLAAATGVAVGATFAWTFSEAILPSAVIPGNFFVFADVAGTMVSGALTQNVAGTVVTFTPAGNLAGTTAYRAVATNDICDLSGNKLAATDVRKITTV